MEQCKLSRVVELTTHLLDNACCGCDITIKSIGRAILGDIVASSLQSVHRIVVAGNLSHELRARVVVSAVAGHITQAFGGNIPDECVGGNASRLFGTRWTRLVLEITQKGTGSSQTGIQRCVDCASGRIGCTQRRGNICSSRKSSSDARADHPRIKRTK